MLHLHLGWFYYDVDDNNFDVADNDADDADDDVDEDEVDGALMSPQDKEQAVVTPAVEPWEPITSQHSSGHLQALLPVILCSMAST